LVRRSDFERHLGEVVKVELAVASEGRRRFRGPLLGVDESAVRVRIEGADGAADVPLPFNDMAEARLVMSDDLIAAALRRGKAQAKEGKGRRGVAPASLPSPASGSTHEE
jgi:ribosome maturation factor RimP